MSISDGGMLGAQRQTDRQTDTRQQQTVGHMEQSYAGTEHMGILPVSDTNH